MTKVYFSLMLHFLRPHLGTQPAQDWTIWPITDGGDKGEDVANYTLALKAFHPRVTLNHFCLHPGIQEQAWPQRSGEACAWMKETWM